MKEPEESPERRFFGKVGHMKITFVQTGGTIDKDYPQGETHHGYNFEIKDPAFERMLKRINPKFEYEVVSVFKKDSLDITPEDRKRLLAAVQKIQDERIIITHGTDTIYETAKELSSIGDKTIVLTGAMLPEKFYDSDAVFNLGMAIGVVQVLDRGVYIALHGRVVPWQEFQRLS